MGTPQEFLNEVIPLKNPDIIVRAFLAERCNRSQPTNAPAPPLQLNYKIPPPPCLVLLSLLFRCAALFLPLPNLYDMPA